MRMRELGVLTGFICAATVAVTAQDSASKAAVAQNAPQPTYTPDVMLQRIGAQQNAALGYWMAFAQMREIPVGSSAQDTNALLDANAAALATLARATRLSSCDWGIDYELGPNAPIAYLPKARALARVNSAAAVRSMALGRVDQAIEQWLVGMRFALHIESGGTLISTLSAWSALRDTWDGMTPWAAEGRLTPAQRARLADAVRKLPETVFDWDRAVLNEARVLQTQAALAKPGPGAFVPPTAAETKRFLREIERVADAFNRSPDQTAPIAAAFENDTEVNRFYRESMPSLTKTNVTRREVKAARERILARLK